MYKKFIIKKDILDKGDVVPAGGEILIMDDHIYYNGFMIAPGSYLFFRDLIDKEIEKENYLHEVPIPYNKC